MSLDQSTYAAIKASAQLLYHSLRSTDKLVAERACLTQVEGENANLSRQLKAAEKELKAKDASIAHHKKEYDLEHEALMELNKQNDGVLKELAEAKACIAHLEAQEAAAFLKEK